MNTINIKKIIIKDNFGETYEEYYNKHGLITKRVYKSGTIETFTYDYKNNLIKFTNSKNKYANSDYIYKNGLLVESITGDIKTIYQYNEKGLLIYTRSDDYETWYEYNEDDKLIMMKDSIGYIENHEYNNQGLIIKTINTNGYEIIRRYNDKGLETYYKSTDSNIEIYNEYDENGNKIYISQLNIKTKNIISYDIKYNKYGLIKSKISSNGNEILYSYEFY